MPHRFQTLKKLMETNHLLSSDGETASITLIPLPGFKICSDGAKGCVSGCGEGCDPGCQSSCYTCQSGSANG